MNYNNCNPEVSIDFIEVTFQTLARTNLQTVQPKISHTLGLPDGKDVPVRVIDPEEGGSASTFAFRIQDPKNFIQVAEVVAGLRRRLDIADLRISGVEVSLDLWPQSPATREELAEVVTHLYRFSAYHPSENRRIYREGRGGAKDVPARVEALQRALAGGYTLGVGQHRGSPSRRGYVARDPIAQRYYVKTTDDRAELPRDQWRARMEVTMQDEAAPTLEELATFDFTGLRDKFALRMLRDDLHPMLDYALNRYAFPTGEKKPRPSRRRHPRQFSPATVADSAMNSRVRDALRKLTRAWMRGAVRANLGKTDPTNPQNQRGSAPSSNNYNHQPLTLVSVTLPVSVPTPDPLFRDSLPDAGERSEPQALSDEAPVLPSPDESVACGSDDGQGEAARITPDCNVLDPADSLPDVAATDPSRDMLLPCATGAKPKAKRSLLVRACVRFVGLVRSLLSSMSLSPQPQ